MKVLAKGEDSFQGLAGIDLHALILTRKPHERVSVKAGELPSLIHRSIIGHPLPLWNDCPVRFADFWDDHFGRLDTQEELCYELNRLNFNVTQATISRDIKDLKLYKISGTTKKYKYAFLDSDDDTVTGRMKNLFSECVQTINYANNIIIIKTMRGNGATAGTFVDSLQLKEILGCVAGDDTLLIVVNSNENALIVTEKLREYMA